ncbi:MAG: FAD-dependent oxidoreductase [Bacteroidetes bacterium]|nr:MAG: FAD-dependent oxidoreductase [Bacteroidota bacterium]
MKNVFIIGGGIVGLSSAYYLRLSGCEVTLIDKSDFRDNCSYGNAGYVCPSHFIPLATPGIVRQGLKWIFNSASPFYVQPRLNYALLEWGIRFIRSATRAKVEKAAIPLRDISLLSQKEYESWASQPGFEFSYQHKGLMEIFQTQQKADQALHTVHQALELGLEAKLLSMEELRLMEPQTRINAMGAIYFGCDAHLYPNRLMESLNAVLKKMGVRFLPNEEVRGFLTSRAGVEKVVTVNGQYAADEVVVAAGSWSREMASQLHVRIPLVPGRGYSITLENNSYRLNYPAVLMEGRVAITPIDGNKIRFGGTMEITSTQTPPRIKRVQGILSAVKSYFPDFDTPLPPEDKIWYGYRPCSADGLPYIGRSRKCKNLVIATGHSMLGLSLGAGTGKLVDEIILDKPRSMDITPFDVDRFA